MPSGIHFPLFKKVKKMFVFGLKLLPKLKQAVLMNKDCDAIGMIHIITAADIINQGKKTGKRRWIAFYDNYKLFPKIEGRTFWFDRLNPLYIPKRYLLDIKIITNEVD